MRRGVALVCSGSLVLACGSQSSSLATPSNAAVDVMSSPETGPDGSSPLVVNWSPCSKLTGGTGTDAECATVALPVHWSDPAGPTLDVFVKRIRGATGSRGQLWLLAGGPGHAAIFFESLLPLFTQTVTDLDLYIPDHRGTGRSHRLRRHSRARRDVVRRATVWGD